MLATSFLLAAAPVASAETRTLKLYYTHTREKAEITFKKNGRYIQSGLNELNKFLRDWRRNEPTKMDPRLFDLVWETYQHAGGRDYINVVSAYRSPATNSMLRKRSSGVAEKSQHMLGKAMDFYVPGVKISKLRAAALKVQGGGVGYYPTSGSPFVHIDVGSVRHWPRMKRSELMALFPDGKTIHVPSDGKPLPGYKQAMAAYNSRKKNGGSSIQLASAPAGGNFLSRLFGGGADEAEDSSEIAVASAGGGAGGSLAEISPQVAAAAPARRGSAGSLAEISPNVASAAPARIEDRIEETPETIVAALPARRVPKPLFAPRPQVDVGSGAEMAALFDTDAPAATAALPVEEPLQEEVEVALNIPVPMRRPQYEIETAPTAEEAAQALVASSVVEGAEGVSGDVANTGSIAIAEIMAGDQRPVQVAAVSPVPGSRPDWQQQVSSYAALPQARPAIATPQQAALAAKDATLSLKGGRVMAAMAPATPRLAVLKRAEGIEPARALGTGVLTTGKSARPSAQDSRPDAKAVVIPVQQQIAEWALKTGYATRLRSASEPSLAHNAIRSAPSAVYTGGFSQSGQTADASRFSGKAVTFLSVAKFANN